MSLTAKKGRLHLWKCLGWLDVSFSSLCCGLQEKIERRRWNYLIWRADWGGEHNTPDTQNTLTIFLSAIAVTRGGSRIAATSKIERFGIIVNSWKPLTIITKCSILDVAAVLDPPLKALTYFEATGTGKRFWTKSSFCLSNEIL